MTSAQEIELRRRRERSRLIAVRLAIDPELRRQGTAGIERRLAALLETLPGRMLGAYWPVRGEADLRPLAERLIERGWRFALPAVTGPDGPLDYRRWRPGAAMAVGAFDIPVPDAGEIVRPDIILAPLVGFDAAFYRLGYGRGYFDRTLAALAPRPVAIGIGFEAALLATVFPQPHDIPMDVIVTETRLRRRV
jgi:5-formyltetrahydrofolate cyclo-ligase